MVFLFLLFRPQQHVRSFVPTTVFRYHHRPLACRRSSNSNTPLSDTTTTTTTTTLISGIETIEAAVLQALQESNIDLAAIAQSNAEAMLR